MQQSVRERVQWARDGRIARLGEFIDHGRDLREALCRRKLRQNAAQLSFIRLRRADGSEQHQKQRGDIEGQTWQARHPESEGSDFRTEARKS